MEKKREIMEVPSEFFSSFSDLLLNIQKINASSCSDDDKLQDIFEQCNELEELITETSTNSSNFQNSRTLRRSTSKNSFSNLPNFKQFSPRHTSPGILSIKKKEANGNDSNSFSVMIGKENILIITTNDNKDKQHEQHDEKEKEDDKQPQNNTNKTVSEKTKTKNKVINKFKKYKKKDNTNSELSPDSKLKDSEETPIIVNETPTREVYQSKKMRRKSLSKSRNLFQGVNKDITVAEQQTTSPPRTDNEDINNNNNNNNNSNNINMNNSGNEESNNILIKSDANGVILVEHTKQGDENDDKNTNNNTENTKETLGNVETTSDSQNDELKQTPPGNEENKVNETENEDKTKDPKLTEESRNEPPVGNGLKKRKKKSHKRKKESISSPEATGHGEFHRPKSEKRLNKSHHHHNQDKDKVKDSKEGKEKSQKKHHHHHKDYISRSVMDLKVMDSNSQDPSSQTSNDDNNNITIIKDSDNSNNNNNNNNNNGNKEAKVTKYASSRDVRMQRLNTLSNIAISSDPQPSRFSALMTIVPPQEGESVNNDNNSNSNNNTTNQRILTLLCKSNNRTPYEKVRFHSLRSSTADDSNINTNLTISSSDNDIKRALKRKNHQTMMISSPQMSHDSYEIRQKKNKNFTHDNNVDVFRKDDFRNRSNTLQSSDNNNNTNNNNSSSRKPNIKDIKVSNVFRSEATIKVEGKVGYMWKLKVKKMSISPQWKHRYFHYRNASLFYAAGPTEKPLGEIKLTTAKIRILTPDDLKLFDYAKPFSFELRTLEDTYYLAVNTETELSEWVDALDSRNNIAINAHPHPHSLGAIANSAQVISSGNLNNSDDKRSSSSSSSSSNSSKTSVIKSFYSKNTKTKKSTGFEIVRDDVQRDQSPLPDLLADPNIVKDKKKSIIMEIISTERDYVNDLNIVMTYYINKLEGYRLLRGDQKDAIFGNFVDLVPIHRSLLAELEAEFENEHPNFSPIFQKFGPQFEVYARYCFAQSSSKEAIKQYCDENYNIYLCLEELKTQPEVKKLDLESYLIKPLQRLCKYPLLLRELKNATDENDESYSAVDNALEVISKVVNQVNETKRKADNLIQLLQIQDSIIDKDLFLQAKSRYLVKETEFKKVSVDNAVASRCNVWLFNDLILIAKRKEKNRFLFRAMIQIDSSLTFSDLDPSTPSKDKSTLFNVSITPATLKEKLEWIEQLSQLLPKPSSENAVNNNSQ